MSTVPTRDEPGDARRGNADEKTGATNRTATQQTVTAAAACRAKCRAQGCRNDCTRGDSGHDGLHRCAAGHTW